MNNPAINTITEQNLPSPTSVPLSLVPGGKAPLQQQLVRLEESNRQKLALNLIKTDGGTRTRIQINHAVTAQYAKDMQRGVLFFPVTVFFDGKTYWLADGFYRVAAAKQAGKTSISAYIKPGGQREAKLHAMTANQMHGNPLTSRDKRNAARMLLTDSEWNMWSNRKLAKQALCSEGAIRRYKQELEQEHESALEAPPSAKKTQICQYSKNGKTYFMKTDGLKKPTQSVLNTDVLAALTGLPVLDDSFQVAGLLKLPVNEQMEIASILAENQVQNQVLTFSEAVAELKDKRTEEERNKLIADALQAGYDNHFVNGDCVEVLNTTDLLKPRSVRLLLADGPYGIGFAKHGTSKSLIQNDDTLEKALKVHKDMLAAIEPFMMPDCHIMLFCDKRYEPEFRQVAAEAGYEFKDSLIWDKGDGGRPITNQAMRRHERIIWYTKGKPKVHGFMPDVLVYPRPAKKRTTGSHPTPKSISLLSRLVEATTVENELLADTFAGSGTTLIAAKTLGRKYFGVEQDPEWYRQASADLNATEAVQALTPTSPVLAPENIVGAGTYQESLSSVA